MDAQESAPKPGRPAKGGNRLGFWLTQASVAALILVLFVRATARDRSFPEGKSPDLERSPESMAPRTSPEAGYSPKGGTPEDAEGTPRPAAGIGRTHRRSEGAPYQPENYCSRLAHDDEEFKLWTLDPVELAWLLANQRQILTQDLETVPESTGGLRVLRVCEGSFAALRGIRPGDTVLDINGAEIDGPLEVENFLRDPAHQTSKGWRVRVQRNGTELTIDYRVDP